VKSTAKCCSLAPMRTDNSIPEGPRQRRPSRSRAEWLAEVKSWRNTGQSAKEYATAQGLNEGTLVVWASKLKVLAHERARKAAGASVAGSLTKFLPVRVTEPSLKTGRSQEVRDVRPTTTVRSDAKPEAGGPGREIEIVLLNGRRIRVAACVDEAMLARVLKVAEGAVPC
jgi:hypothetical protein